MLIILILILFLPLFSFLIFCGYFFSHLTYSFSSLPSFPPIPSLLSLPSLPLLFPSHASFLHSHCPSDNTTIRSFFQPLKDFYNHMIDPTYTAVTDVYVPMFLCDLLNFLIVAFASYAFGVSIIYIVCQSCQTICKGTFKGMRKIIKLQWLQNELKIMLYWVLVLS